MSRPGDCGHALEPEPNAWVHQKARSVDNGTVAQVQINQALVGHAEHGHYTHRIIFVMEAPLRRSRISMVFWMAAAPTERRPPLASLFREGEADEVLDGHFGGEFDGDGLDHFLGIVELVAEGAEGEGGVAQAGIAVFIFSTGKGIELLAFAEFIAQFDDDALGGLFSNPRDGGDAFDIAVNECGLEFADGQAAERADGELGADPADGEQAGEHGSLFLVEKPEQLLGGIGDVVVDEDSAGVALGREAVVATERNKDFVADPADVHDDAGGLLVFELAFEECNHDSKPCRMRAMEYSPFSTQGKNISMKRERG